MLVDFGIWIEMEMGGCFPGIRTIFLEKSFYSPSFLLFEKVVIQAYTIPKITKKPGEQ
jgi:hypothetical protein